jgi:hypothetical protein
MFAQSLLTAVKTSHFSRKKSYKRHHILLQESPLAGFQYHRASGIWSFLRVGASLRLKREPHNTHDANAIAVWFMNDQLGYIPRSENGRLAELMDRGERLEVQISKLLDEEDPWQRVRFRVALWCRG